MDVWLNGGLTQPTGIIHGSHGSSVDFFSRSIRMVASESCRYLAWKCTVRPGQGKRKAWKPIKWSANRDPKIWSGLTICNYGQMPTENVIMQSIYITKHENIRKYLREVVR